MSLVTSDYVIARAGLLISPKNYNNANILKCKNEEPYIPVTISYECDEEIYDLTLFPFEVIVFDLHYNKPHMPSYEPRLDNRCFIIPLKEKLNALSDELLRNMHNATVVFITSHNNTSIINRRAKTLYFLKEAGAEYTYTAILNAPSKFYGVKSSQITTHNNIDGTAFVIINLIHNVAIEVADYVADNIKQVTFFRSLQRFAPEQYAATLNGELLKPGQYVTYERNQEGEFVKTSMIDTYCTELGNCNILTRFGINTVFGDSIRDLYFNDTLILKDMQPFKIYSFDFVHKK